MPKMLATAIDATVGRRIKLARKRQGMTLDELGLLSDVSAQMIYGYEQGLSRIYLGRLQQIAKALNFPMSKFMRGL